MAFRYSPNHLEMAWPRFSSRPFGFRSGKIGSDGFGPTFSTWARKPS